MNPIRTTLTTIAAAVLLTGCSSSPSTTEAASGTSTSPPAPARSSTTAASGGVHVNVPADAPASVRAAAVVFATWSRRQLPYDTWWGQLKPLLTTAGQQAYARTDPANIPALRVTGPYRLDPRPPAEPGTSALVHVPTNLGEFGLVMTGNPPGSPWRLLEIYFPPGIH